MVDSVFQWLSLSFRPGPSLPSPHVINVERLVQALLTRQPLECDRAVIRVIPTGAAVVAALGREARLVGAILFVLPMRPHKHEDVARFRGEWWVLVIVRRNAHDLHDARGASVDKCSEDGAVALVGKRRSLRSSDVKLHEVVMCCWLAFMGLNSLMQSYILHVHERGYHQTKPDRSEMDVGMYGCEAHTC